MLAGMRVLLVEDEALLSMMLEQILERLGCEIVMSACRLEDAVVKARMLAIDVALLDINLAGTLSYPVAEVLQARNVPFVFATGYNQSEIPAAFNTTLLLSKPFRQNDLVKMLGAAMSQPRSPLH